MVFSFVVVVLVVPLFFCVIVFLFLFLFCFSSFVVVLFFTCGKAATMNIVGLEERSLGMTPSNSPRAH